MKHTSKKLVGAGIGVVLLIASTALAASYFTRESLQSKAESHKQPRQHGRAPANSSSQKVAATEPSCNDSNIAGVVVGGVAGGVVGHQVGKGSGNTAATIAGTLGGAYLGGQHIPLNNVTCR